MNRGVFIFLFLHFSTGLFAQGKVDTHGAIVRSDTSERSIYLCFTGHDYYEGFDHVLEVLAKKQIQASFFLTGDFVRNHSELVTDMADQGHFIGAHSDKHLLYCDWNKRDSLLHTNEEIKLDISNNLKVLGELDIYPKYFMPPYEWYNQEVVAIAKSLDQITVNFSPGTRSNADYTTPDMKNYQSSSAIIGSIFSFEAQTNLNGFHLLIHPGTSPLREDKLYFQLEAIINWLMSKGYCFLSF